MKRAVLHRFDRAVDRRERGDDDDGQIRVGDANGAQSVDAADARQHHIENRQIDFLGIENVERFLAARRQYDVETLAAEHDLEDVTKNFFVVDDQHAHRFHFAHSILWSTGFSR